MTQRPRFLPFAAATVLVAMTVAGCSKPPVASTPGPAATSPGAEVSDIDVTAHVKTALLQTDSLKGAEIAVVTLKGDVRLTGVLDNQAQIDDALRVARTADGAHTIHDELTTRK